jgi:hypothetical protein
MTGGTITIDDIEFQTHPNGVIINGSGIIVAARVLSPEQEPSVSGLSMFTCRLSSGDRVLSFVVSPHGFMQWRAFPGTEIILHAGTPILAQCTPTRIFDIAVRSFDSGPERGIRVNESGLRELSQREMLDWIRSYGCAT